VGPPKRPQIEVFFLPKFMFYTYILHSKTLDKYYVGSTNNIEDRIQRHNQGRSTFTKTGIPWELLYFETYQTRSEAYQRELFIKSKKSKSFIAQLVQGTRSES
jgi:putative endonuclease